jgi:hypothetical protein
MLKTFPSQLSDKPVQVAILAACGVFLTSAALLAVTLSRPEPVITHANVEDPVGSRNALKTTIANWMAWIAQRKEVRKSSEAETHALESWHKPENHAFFNESYYFNGCDKTNRDRFITRISRRSYNGSRSYVFLLLDLKDHGTFALEEDVAAENSKNPTAMGLSYKCEIPMRRWKIRYSGPMRRNCTHPRNYEALANSERVHVELDLTYETESPLFWYMRDDHPTCLASNLAQETWGMDFLRVCIKRTVDHAHYEDFGRAKGKISINHGPPQVFDFGTFRDHSWDIRRWATMDKLNILLIALEKPLKLFKNHEYWYLDLTIVDMPGNVGGVASYSTGYAVGNNPSTPKLALVSGSSIRDFKYTAGVPGIPGGDSERRPTSQSEVIMRLTLHPRDVPKGEEAPQPRLIKIIMKGDERRLIYWPDQGAFICYEDCPSFDIIDIMTGESVVGYGTRQTGFRVGEFDPTLGGCG